MDNYSNQTPKGMRLAFGIFMVLFYVAVGIFFIVNILNINNKTLSIIVGAILCAYGVFRGYRLYKGMN